LVNVKAKLYEGVKCKGSQLGENVYVGSYSKIFFSKCNGNVIVGERSHITKSDLSGDITIGENCKIHETTLSGNIQIGKFTSLWGPNLDIYTGDQMVKIGNFCSIARNVSFQTFNHNQKKITSYFIGQNLFNEKWKNEKVSKGNIEIGNDVWIGTQCVILGGVKIDDGVLVAANSVVTTNLPAFSIVAGTPAKVIGYRFDTDTINKIMELKWWNWSTSKIMENKHLFIDEINEDFLKEFKNE
jgi:acetyltransferase-like isoleucine patch superfamily enzyme